MTPENYALLLDQAEQAFANRDSRTGMACVLQILNQDFTNDPAWRLLYRVLKPNQPFDVFQLELAKKNFPAKAHLLEKAPAPALQGAPPASWGYPSPEPTRPLSSKSCPCCGKPIDDRIQFCGHCGCRLGSPAPNNTPLTSTVPVAPAMAQVVSIPAPVDCYCNRCGQPLAAQAPFCGFCGSPVQPGGDKTAAPGAPPQPAAWGGTPPTAGTGRQAPGKDGPPARPASAVNPRLVYFGGAVIILLLLIIMALMTGFGGLLGIALIIGVAALVIFNRTIWTALVGTIGKIAAALPRVRVDFQPHVQAPAQNPQPIYAAYPPPTPNRFTPKRVISAIGMLLIIVAGVLVWAFSREWRGIFGGGYSNYGVLGVETANGIVSTVAAMLGITFLFAKRNETTAHLFCLGCAAIAGVAALLYKYTSNWGYSGGVNGLLEDYSSVGVGVYMVLVGLMVVFGCLFIPSVKTPPSHMVE